MHLIIVSPYPPNITGIGQYGYHVSRALAQSGFFTRITVMTGAQGSSRPIDELPVPISVERTWQSEQLDTGWKITNRVRRMKPDLVWFNLGASIFGRSPLANFSGFLAPGWTQQAGFPTVVTLHELLERADLRALNAPGGPFARHGAHLLTNIATRADVVCLTLHQHAEYLSQSNSNTRVMHIPHGTFTHPLLLPDDENLEILFFGSIAPFKGLELLLKVFRDLHSRYPLLSLVIAGEEHPRFPEYLKDMKRVYGNDPAIRWLGYIPENELRRVFSRATLVVIPSTATTGSSSVLYRAAGWGRAIIASDLPELKAIANEENLSIEFFPSGDDAGLGSAIERLLKDTAQRKAQAHHNYRIIKGHLTLAHTCHAYLQAFNLALESHRSPKRITIPAQAARIFSESV